MEASLGKKALTGTVWKFAERFAAQGISTIVGIILARLLDPEHYGIIAIVNVFITMCNVFVVTGLGEALIQKKDADELDFSSIFYVNVGISIVLYVIVFVSAPFISNFYGDGYEQLTVILRVMGLRLVMAAINSIQHARIARDLAFKKYFWVTLIGTAVSAVVGIAMAYSGFGVWALVSQYMTNTTIDTIMLFIFVKWFPKPMFSFKRVKGLVKYGSRLLAVAVVTTFLDELESLLIGKVYSAKDLAYYSKSNTYPGLVVKNLATAISSAIFPVLSKLQNDINAMREIASKAVKMISFVVFPALCGLALVADDFLLVLLTEKWLPCAPYLKLLCLYYALYPFIMTNSQCLTASGDSKTYARITTFVRAIGLVILIISIKFGVMGIVIGRILGRIIEYIIKTVPTKNRLNYGFLKQLKDLMPSIIGCALMSVAVLAVKYFTLDINRLFALILQVGTGGITYFVYALITKNEQLMYGLNLLKKMKK